MRILLCLHHYLDPNQGAPGVTLALGQALEVAGCEVEYFGFDHAFPKTGSKAIGNSVRFPWRLASFLSHEAGNFDVIDISTGDAWVWGMRKRPSAKGVHALITRSHGLEHIMDQQRRSFSRDTGQRLSWKYPLYHGGYRLWEVQQSIRISDHSIMLNDEDKKFVSAALGVSGKKVSVLPHAIADVFHQATPVTSLMDGTLRLAYIGNWLPMKGVHVLVDAASRLGERNMQFTLSLYGTGQDADVIRGHFPPRVRDRVRVIPRYQSGDLPSLLAEEQVLLFPTLSEGFGLALFEAMACGLVPVTTPLGGASTVIQHGINGIFVPLNDSKAMAQAVCAFDDDRNMLWQMRRRAQESVDYYRWNNIAAETIALYNSVLRKKLEVSG